MVPRPRSIPRAASFVVTTVLLALVTGPLSAQRSEDARLYSSDAPAPRLFGHSVAVDGDIAVVGAPSDNGSGWLVGAAYVLRRVNFAWTHEAKLTPSTGAAVGRFGSSVAVSGGVIVVGAPGDSTQGSPFSGAVYVYRFDGSSWIEEQVLPGYPNGGSNDQFGFSVAVDGARIAIGAPRDDAASPWNPAGDSGAVYIYERPWLFAPWQQTAKLIASDSAPGDLFGTSVGLSGDRVVVGAAEKPTGLIDAGAAYVFGVANGVWSQEAKLTSLATQHLARFGASVSISATRVLVGAPDEDSSGVDAGAAYLYGHDGVAWTLERRLLASDIAAGDRYGASVSIDGAALAVAAPGDTQSGQAGTGSAYSYELSGGVWIESSKLRSSDGIPVFADAIALSHGTVLVGAGRDHSAGAYAGSVYVFEPPCGGIATPFNLQTVATRESVRVSWDAETTDVNAFVVERSVNAGAFSVVAWVSTTPQVGVRRFSWTDTGVTPGQTLCYRVIAVRVDGVRGCPSPGVCTSIPRGPFFLRGDVSSNGKLDTSDLELLDAFLLGKAELECLDAADVDDDGRLTPNDFSALAAFIYKDSEPPARPFSSCGEDSSPDELDCEHASFCGE